MRQLSQADPSPVVGSDIRVFEQARFKELRLAYARRVRDRDNAVILPLQRVDPGAMAGAVPPIWQPPTGCDQRRGSQAAVEVLNLTKLRAVCRQSLSTCTTLLAN